MRDGGYFLRDDRLSGGTLTESVTFTCTHCSCVVVMNPERRRDRAFCFKCNHVICDACGAMRECRPLQSKFEMLERKIVHGQA